VKCPKCGTEFYGSKCPKCGYEPTEYDMAIDTLMQLTGVGRKRAEELYKAGFKDIESIARSEEKELAKVKTIGMELAKKIKKEAKKFSEDYTEEFVRICNVCGAIVPPDAEKCPRCGAPVNMIEEEKKTEVEGEEETTLENKVICPFCGALIDKGTTHCPVCGSSLENIDLEEPKPMEDPYEVLKRFFGVTEIPEYTEKEENPDIRVCPNCGAIVVNRDKCPLCGSPIPEVRPVKREEEEIDLSERLQVCPNCGAFIAPDLKVCPICGSQIENAEEISVSLADILNSKLETEDKMDLTLHGEEPSVMDSMDTLTDTSQESTSGEFFGTDMGISDEISPEELEEIESSLSQEFVNNEIAEHAENELKPEEIGTSIDELMDIIPEEEKLEFTRDDLTSIQQSLDFKKPQEQTATVKQIDMGIKSPVEKTPETVIEENVGFGERFNTFIKEFGNIYDILAFSPLFVLLIFFMSSLSLTGTALTILTQSVSIFMFSLGFLMTLAMYRTLREYTRMEKIMGLAFLITPLAILSSYSIYIVSAISIFAIYVAFKKGYDYWIPYSGISIAFSLSPVKTTDYLILSIALFITHTVQRFRGISIEITTSEKMSVEKLYEEGVKAFKEKRYYDAIYYLRRVLKTKPEDIEIINMLGLSYGRIGNTDMALEMFKKAISLNPRYKLAWNNMGNIYARMEDYDKAISCYREALKIDPNYEDALLNMGYVMIRRGSLGEAMKIAEKMKIKA